MPGGSRASRPWLAAAAVAGQLLGCCARCSHHEEAVQPPAAGEPGSSAGGNYTVLQEGVPVSHELLPNLTRLYYYENFNVTTMNQPDRYRKLIVSLEPCEGVVYLFVRKTRQCWPDPHSCCRPLAGSSGTLPVAPPCNLAAHSVKCSWTHFHSVVDGSKDGAPTFFELPLGSTKYFISVFAPYDVNVRHGVQRAKYRLTALTDIGAYPRPGLQGRLQARQAGEMAVELTWEQATFIPAGVSGLSKYHVYSSLLLHRDRKVNEAVFLTPSKVMNTACGLQRNAVPYGEPLTSASCSGGVCAATVSGVVPRRRYMFNIISESHRGFRSTYSGIVVSTDWTESDQLLTDNVVALVGGICGTVFGVVVIGYIWIVKLYK